MVFGNIISNTKDSLTQVKMNPGIAMAEHGIKTIEGSKAKFTKRNVKKIHIVQRFQHVAGHTSNKSLIHMATKRTIKDSPIVPKDVQIANKILGPSVYSIKGKRTYRGKDVVETNDTIPIPKTIKEHYMNLTIAADVMHVNQIPILAMISCGIHYGTLTTLPAMKLDDLEEALIGVMRAYALQSFTVRFIMVDIQFKGLKDRFEDLQTRMNVVSKKEHVPEIKRFIRVIKERARAYFTMIPFMKVPKKMVLELIHTVIFYLNGSVSRIVFYYGCGGLHIEFR